MTKKIRMTLFLLALAVVLAPSINAEAAFPGVSEGLHDVAEAIRESRAADNPAGGNMQAGVVNAGIDFRGLVKAAGPAVVNISTERTARVRPMPFPFGDEFFRGHPFFDDDMGPFGGRNNMPRERKQASLGSGFIISADGYIVTNNHVVEGAELIRVNFDGSGPKDKENSYTAQVIGTDSQTDLALLKIDAGSDLPFIKFGDSDALEVGDWVLAIGNPFGLDHTVTAGILSAKFRNIDSSSLVRFLQTDASINPGNSGGPLLNLKGEVIGINTAIAAQGQGIGFAIPSSLASKIIDDLKSDRKVSRGWLGVHIQDVSPAAAKALGLEDAKGALIGSVLPDQPAAKAGIEAGDVILKIDDKDIASSEELMRTIADMRPGVKIKATIWRDGKARQVEIVLAEREAGEKSVTDKNDKGENAKPDAEDNSSLGISLRPLSKQEATRLRMDPKLGGLVIIQADPDKLAAKSGLQRGDVILSVGRQPVKSVEQFNKAVQDMAKKQGAVILQVSRNGQRFMRAIEMGK